MAADRHQIENFLYREARLMDEHAYDEWLSLWTEDALYWVPSNDDDMDPTQQVAIIYDNLAQMQNRIDRLKGGAAYSQPQISPATCRLEYRDRRGEQWRGHCLRELQPD